MRNGGAGVVFVRFVVISLSLIACGAFGGTVSSILPPHEPGFFVEFTAIGWSSGSFEISTQPLFDIVGAFNVKFRLYPHERAVVHSESYVIDVFFMPRTYGGVSITETLVAFLTRNYFHTNIVLGKLVLRPHIEFIGTGVFQSQGGGLQFNLPLFAKAFVNVGYMLNDNVELFGTVEGTTFLLELTNSSTSGIINPGETFVGLRVGTIWYYDRYSGVEVGFRIPLVGANSPVRFVQGYNLTDLIYNLTTFNSGSEYSPFGQLNIPFITTDYYLSFTTKF